MSVNGHSTFEPTRPLPLGETRLTGAARFAKIASFPTSLTVYRAKSGHMVYSMNKAVSVRSLLGNIDQQAGSYSGIEGSGLWGK